MNKNKVESRWVTCELEYEPGCSHWSHEKCECECHSQRDKEIREEEKALYKKRWQKATRKLNGTAQGLLDCYEEFDVFMNGTDEAPTSNDNPN